MGGNDYGFNSLYGNATYDVYSLQTYQTDATNNYWGADLTASYYGNVDCSSPLTSMPKSIAGASNESSGTISAISEENPNENYQKARDLEKAGQYSEAIIEFQYVIDNFSESYEAKMSLLHLRRCYSKLKIPEDFIVNLKEVSIKHKNTELGAIAEFTTIPSLVEAKAYEEALAISLKISENYSKSELGRAAQIETFQNYFNLQKDLKSARNEMEQYEKTYGTDGELVFMKLALGDIDAGDVIEIAKEFVHDEAMTDEFASEIMREENLPKEFELSDNYPNPFNPVTTIRFGLPEAAHVLVQIFDTTGRLVTTLADLDYEAGRFQVRFDAKGLASGIYFSKVKMVSTEDKTNSRMFTGKLTLLK